MSPKRLFKLQEGSSKDRALIAKYCIKDCSLCNVLMEKIQILINNVGMANVCHVPLSYIFVRGQSVKIQSILAKACMKKNTLMPTLKKKYETKQKIIDISFTNKDSTIKCKAIGKLKVGEHVTITYKKNNSKTEKDYMKAKAFEVINIIKEGDYYLIIVNEDISNRYSKQTSVKDGSPVEIKNVLYCMDDLTDKPKYNVSWSRVSKKMSDEELNEKMFEEHLKQLNQNSDFCKEDENDLSYDGAIVFPPKVGIYRDPIVVLDYSSLYPRSAIWKNLSHEYHVKDPKKYGNIKGYKYRLIWYKTHIIKEPMTKLKELIGIYKSKKDEYIIEKTREDLDVDKVVKNLDVYIIYGKNIVTDKLEKDKLNIVSKIYIDNEEIPTSSIIFDKEGTAIIEKPNIEKQYKRLGLIIYKYKTSMFAQKNDNSMGIFTETLLTLLEKREEVKTAMDNEKDPAKKAVLNGLQLAYKITANSGYGATGASTSPICNKEIAAAITATGREALEFSRDFFEKHYGNMVNYALEDKEKFRKYFYNMLETIVLEPESLKGKLINKKAKYTNKNGKEINVPYTNKEEFVDAFYEVINDKMKGYSIFGNGIYGDTDSVFINMNIIEIETGKKMQCKKALDMGITLGIWGSHAINIFLPYCMSQAYEKVLWPFAIVSKKKYVGNLYEKNPNKCKLKSMGIVLKRRDYAPIAKIVLAGIIDQIINHEDGSKGAVKFARETLKNILEGKYSLDKFIITKSLKSHYANRSGVIQAVIADRMKDRDEGSAPRSGDRIPYAFIQTYGKTEKQLKLEKKGARAEHIDYIIEKKLKIDYVEYIKCQIMEPAIQFLALIIKNPEKIFIDAMNFETNKKKGKRTIKSYGLFV